MSDEDFNDKAIKLFNAASELDPRKSKFGIMTVDSSLGAYDIWCFLWFVDAKDLSKFFKDSFCYTCCAIDEDDEELLDEVKDLAKYIKTIPPEDGVMQELADYCNGVESIAWWGSFENLCADPSDIAKKVRASFRKPDAELLYSDPEEWRKKSNLTDPIQENEISMFVDYLINLKNG